MSFDYSTLITDRAAADVASLSALLARAAKGQTLTAEEWEILKSPTNKGAYNYIDLNRVTEALEDLNGRLNKMGYATEYVQTTLNWTEADAPTPEQMQRYLWNVEAMRKVLIVPPELPPTPGSMENLTAQAANEIETILIAVDVIIHNVLGAMFRSGDLFSGEV